MTRLSTLSHLFARAAVSAELLRGDESYKSQIVEILKNAEISADIENPRPTFVLSIITEKKDRYRDQYFCSVQST